MKLDINNKIENNIEKLTKKIIDNFSFIIYKQIRKPKGLRIKSLNGYYNMRDYKNYNLIYKTKILIELTNYDIIEGNLSINENSSNNITIKINNKIIYNLDNEKFNNEILIDKMKDKYIYYIKKTYKIR